MTIEEARAKRNELEHDLLVKMKIFEEASGLAVTRVEITRTETNSSTSTVIANVSCALRLE